MKPIFHTHVKVIDKRKSEKGDWFALFKQPDGTKEWMQQPFEPEIDSEQILYVFKDKTRERIQLECLVQVLSLEELQEWIKEKAKNYGEWCEKTWEEARKELDPTLN